MKKIIHVEYDDVILNTDINTEIAPIINGIEYFPTSVAEIRFDVTRQHLITLTNKLDKRERSQYVFKTHGRNYYSSGVMFLQGRLRKQLKNYPYARWLSHYTWDYAITVSFPNSNVSEDIARRHLTNYWSCLTTEMSQSRINLFMSAEKNPDGCGRHLHGVIRVIDDNARPLTERVTKNFFRRLRGEVRMEDYREEGVWTGYIVKQIDRNIDSWDILQYRGIKQSAMNLI